MKAAALCFTAALSGAAGLRVGTLTMRMPTAVLDLVPAEIRANAIFAQATESNWNALRACYPSEEAGIEALAIGLPVILPYGADTQVSGFMEAGEAVNRSENIRGSYEVLSSKFDGDQAKVLEVITKNPGVLGCIPTSLDQATQLTKLCWESSIDETWPIAPAVSLRRADLPHPMNAKRPA